MHHFIMRWQVKLNGSVLNHADKHPSRLNVVTGAAVRALLFQQRQRIENKVALEIELARVKRGSPSDLIAAQTIRRPFQHPLSSTDLLTRFLQQDLQVWT